MRAGQLVKYTHWESDPLLSPEIKYGTVLREPNEVGKVLVLFGSQKLWVWCGDISMVNNERNGRN